MWLGLVAVLWVSDVDTTVDVFVVGDGVVTTGDGFWFLSFSEVFESGTGSFFNGLDTFSGFVGGFDNLNVLLGGEVVDQISVNLFDVGECDDIGLGQDETDWLVLEKWFKGVEELDLTWDGVGTGLRNIDEEQDSSLQMGQSSDGLHFNGVSGLEWVI